MRSCFWSVPLYDWSLASLRGLGIDYDASGNKEARYLHGPGIDEPLLQLVDGAAYAYHGDGLGSVTRITDGDGNAVRAYEYKDAFGSFTSSGSLENPFAFTGREWDAAPELCTTARGPTTLRTRVSVGDPAGMVEGPNR